MRVVGVAVPQFGFDDYYAARVSGSPPQASRSARAVTYCDMMSLAIATLDKRLSGDPTFHSLVGEGVRVARAAARAAAACAETPATKPRSLMRSGGRGWPSLSDIKKLKKEAEGASPLSKSRASSPSPSVANGAKDSQPQEAPADAMVAASGEVPAEPLTSSELSA